MHAAPHITGKRLLVSAAGLMRFKIRVEFLDDAAPRIFLVSHWEVPGVATIQTYSTFKLKILVALSAVLTVVRIASGDSESDGSWEVTGQRAGSR